MDLKTTYMGIELKNPIIIGASNLVLDLNMAKKLEEAGAAAIVYKSLFEEQLHLEAAELEEELHEFDDIHAEMTTLFPNIEHSGPKAHLLALKKLKETVSIPVFASLNCTYDVSWVEYAKYLEETGVDGLELNFYSTISDVEKSPADVENERIEVLKKVKAAVKIPVSVKLSPFYTNMMNVVYRMDHNGADGFVLFNRLFQPDIDIKEEKLRVPYNLSHKGDNRLALRFAGLLSCNLNGSICSNTGIHDGEDVITMLLAGANAVQVVSTVYKNGVVQITRMLEDISAWMKEKGYDKIDDFKGKLCKKNVDDPHAYRRGQYVDYLMNAKEYLKKYPVG
ncbi:dihydroorotate dehydrogenase-like protein [Carboxylicivirga sediminis]|uniref:Dihydroorotate dehydrogenase-like protein n=1 Tax=Carboxylicivirga sediminis TaxID=2006564 RepID=A0A941J0Y1_9BACT|nr:dihydroorotate dehydrogenase-like protein [Carboxylicivirga sediminis]MBR8537612.1 dihydroorotate dehydrogenase-like protein [Carboxylicivirga sediminis]